MALSQTGKYDESVAAPTQTAVDQEGTPWLLSFDPAGSFNSPGDALVQIVKQANPLKALLAVVEANVRRDECGFASEVVRDFNSFAKPAELTEFFVMTDGDQSVDCFPTIEKARSEGQRLCDQDPLPSVWSIADTDGNEIEQITRSDGKSLSHQVASFNAIHCKKMNLTQASAVLILTIRALGIGGLTYVAAQDLMAGSNLHAVILSAIESEARMAVATLKSNGMTEKANQQAQVIAAGFGFPDEANVISFIDDVCSW